MMHTAIVGSSIHLFGLIYSYNLVTHYKVISSILRLIHMPKCPSRPSVHFSSICMSKAEESLRGNQPQRHGLRAQHLPGAAEAPSAFGEGESESPCRFPLGGGESSYSNSVENASTHRGTVTHSWDNKYHRETRDPPANWHQSMDFSAIHRCHQSWVIPKSQWISPVFALEGAIGKTESVCHVIQDVVYRTTGGRAWGETVWGYEMHSLGGWLELEHWGIQSTQHTATESSQFVDHTLFPTVFNHVTQFPLWFPIL